MEQKKEIISLNIPKKIEDEDSTEDDESKEPAEFIEQIFRKHYEIKKRKIRQLVNDYIKIIIKGNLN